MLTQWQLLFIHTLLIDRGDDSLHTSAQLASTRSNAGTKAVINLVSIFIGFRRYEI